MKKILILCSVFLLFSAGTASALSYDFWDFKLFDVKLKENSNPYSYVHDITDDVDFSSEYVTSAYLWIFLVDDLFDRRGRLRADENVFADIEGSWQSVGEPGHLFEDNLFKLAVDPTALSDGYLNVSLSVFDQWEDSELGDVYLFASKLKGHTAPVPEPGTILLLGMGLLGFGIASRKKFFNKWTKASSSD